MEQKERYYEVDLIRFLAAVSVVFYHYTFRGYAMEGLPSLSFPFLANIFKYGYLGVDLFFMISGFVILLTAMNTDIKGFVISRVSRLYPAFWVSVTISAIVIVLIGGDRYFVEVKQYLANLSMVSGYFGVKAVDGVYWTLLVEIKFYLLVGGIVFFRQVQNTKYFLMIWLLATVLAVYIDMPSLLNAVLIPKWSSYFIAGAAFYFIRKEGVSITYLAMVFISYLLSIKYADIKMQSLEEEYQANFSIWVVLGIISMFYVTMFAVSINKIEFANKKSMLMIGGLTYPLYLIHQNVGLMIFIKWGQEVNKYLLLLLVVVLMLVVSYVINKYVEKTIGALMKRALTALALGKNRQRVFTSR
jgi:peptidoglycan/LPS O-acetylase OafA/YrhL